MCTHKMCNQLQTKTCLNHWVFEPSRVQLFVNLLPICWLKWGYQSLSTNMSTNQLKWVSLPSANCWMGMARRSIHDSLLKMGRIRQQLESAAKRSWVRIINQLVSPIIPSLASLLSHCFPYYILLGLTSLFPYYPYGFPMVSLLLLGIPLTCVGHWRYWVVAQAVLALSREQHQSAQCQLRRALRGWCGARSWG